MIRTTTNRVYFSLLPEEYRELYKYLTKEAGLFKSDDLGNLSYCLKNTTDREKFLDNLNNMFYGQLDQIGHLDLLEVPARSLKRNEKKRNEILNKIVKDIESKCLN